MTLFEREPQLLPRLGLLVREHEYAALEVGELDAPAHREHVLGVVRVVTIELHVDPLHQILRVLNIVQLELDLDHAQGEKEGEEDFVVGGWLFCGLWHPTEKGL